VQTKPGRCRGLFIVDWKPTVDANTRAGGLFLPGPLRDVSRPHPFMSQPITVEAASLLMVDRSGLECQACGDGSWLRLQV
jgi:hypothetical protein